MILSRFAPVFCDRVDVRRSSDVRCQHLLVRPLDLKPCPFDQLHEVQRAQCYILLDLLTKVRADDLQEKRQSYFARDVLAIFRHLVNPVVEVGAQFALVLTLWVGHEPGAASQRDKFRRAFILKENAAP